MAVRVVASLLPSDENARGGDVEYTIVVAEGGREWKVRKHYRDFRELDDILRALPLRHYLPPRGLVGLRARLSRHFLHERQEGLREYLVAQLEQLEGLSDERFADARQAMDDFLGPDELSSFYPVDDQNWTRVIQAGHMDELDADCADTIALLGYEAFIGNLPRDNSGVFGVACRLGPLDAEGRGLLEETLRQLVTACPHLAGRVRRCSVALCNAGVPFTFVSCAGGCPADVPHEDIFAYCDARAPPSIMAGSEPLLTVKVSSYTDGAVLGVAVSHCLMDGSSLFGLLNGWGRLCRGEAHGLLEGMAGASRAPLRQALRRRLPGTAALEQPLLSFFHRVDGNAAYVFEAASGAVKQTVSSAALVAASALVPCLVGGHGSRFCLVVPPEQLQALKAAATPPGSWVSTQEAVVAHLLISLWKTFRAGACGGSDRAKVSFFVDVRRYLGLADNVHFGTGFQVVDVFVNGMARTTLALCAETLHAESRSFEELATRKWHLWHHAFEDEVRLQGFVSDAASQPSSDLALAINNNSKREMPDFGPAGGRATSVASSMGPTLLLATRSGLEIILDHDLLARATQEQQDEFRERFRAVPE